MNDYTQEQIDQFAKEIKVMDQFSLCYYWRFSKAGNPRFRTDLITTEGKSLGDLFSEELKAKGGFTPEISKLIGW